MTQAEHCAHVLHRSPLAATTGANAQCAAGCTASSQSSSQLDSLPDIRRNAIIDRKDNLGYKVMHLDAHQFDGPLPN